MTIYALLHWFFVAILKFVCIPATDKKSSLAGRWSIANTKHPASVILRIQITASRPRVPTTHAQICNKSREPPPIGVVTTGKDGRMGCSASKGPNIHNSIHARTQLPETLTPASGLCHSLLTSAGRSYQSLSHGVHSLTSPRN